MKSSKVITGPVSSPLPPASWSPVQGRNPVIDKLNSRSPKGPGSAFAVWNSSDPPELESDYGSRRTPAFSASSSRDQPSIARAARHC